MALGASQILSPKNLLFGVTLGCQCQPQASACRECESSKTEPVTKLSNRACISTALQMPRQEETMPEGAVRSEEVAGMRFVKTREGGLEPQKKPVCSGGHGVESHGFRDPLWGKSGLATA